MSHLWASPMVIDSRPTGRGAFASIGEYFADYRGRKMEMKEILVGAGITPSLAFWISRQEYLIKGRSRTSRFDVDSNSYGAKWVVKPAAEDGQNTLALEFEAVIPGRATARTSSSFAQFNATKNNRFAVDYGFGNGWQSQLGYTNIKGSGSGDANVYSLGAGKDLQLSDRLDLRLQGQLFAQSYTDAVQRVDMELKTMFYGALGYRVANNAKVVIDGALFPGGMPLSSGRFTGLSSFQIYRPGGVAEGLRSDTVGFAALRLVLSARF